MSSRSLSNPACYIVRLCSCGTVKHYNLPIPMRARIERLGMWLDSIARVKQHELRKTCGLFSPMLPEQRKDAEEFEALRLNREAGLSLHVSGGCLGRRLPCLHWLTELLQNAVHLATVTRACSSQEETSQHQGSHGQWDLHGCYELSCCAPASSPPEPTNRSGAQ